MVILCLELLFTIVKNNKDIESLKILGNTFLYTAYADDTNFFLKKMGSIKELLNRISLFSLFSGLKPKFSKWEVTGIGLLNRVKVSGCGIKCIDLRCNKNTRNFFLYNKNIELEQNFKKTIISIEKILRVWRQRILTLEGKIIIFKTLTLSKFLFLVQVLRIPHEITTTIQQIISMKFLWDSSNVEIKHETICNDFQNGGLKNVDIPRKMLLG